MKTRILRRLISAAVFIASATSLAACYYPDDYRYRDYAYRRDYYEPGRYYYYDRDWRDRDGYWHRDGYGPHYPNGDRVYHED
jgi:hypothetical protein